MAPDPNQMRIHVGPSGDVEFSVALTSSVDPSLVATMVAAVRAGIVHNKSTSYEPAPSTAPEPTSDPDADLARAERPLTPPMGPACNPAPTSTPPARSVRQLAAQLEAVSSPRPHRYSTTTAPPSRRSHDYDHGADDYDPVREFSSSPALWLTRSDAYHDSASRVAPPSFLRSSSARDPSRHSSRSRPTHGPSTLPTYNHADRPERLESRSRPRAAGHDCSAPVFASRPVRMLSLPPGSPHDVVDGMCFDESGSAAVYRHAEVKPVSDEIGSHSPSTMADVHHLVGTATSLELARAVASPAERVRARRDRATKRADHLNEVGQPPIGSLAAERALSELGDMPSNSATAGQEGAVSPERAISLERAGSAEFPVSPETRAVFEDDDVGGNDGVDGLRERDRHILAASRGMDHRAHAHDRPAVPSAPYVQQSEAGDEEADPEDAWDNVEYVLTESYRQDAKTKEFSTGPAGVEHIRPHSRFAAWRLLSSIGSIGNGLSKKRVEAEEDVHQSTLAVGGPFKSEKSLAPPEVGVPSRRNRMGMFSRSQSRSGGLWLEFSSSLTVERMLAEVGKVSKTLGYQVWRRPGENKLRCIRKLSHRHEMHMVILVGSFQVSDGTVSVVRLKRARGDRNRTEAWRYSQFYRELIDRLQRQGIEITSEV